MSSRSCQVLTAVLICSTWSGAARAASAEIEKIALLPFPADGRPVKVAPPSGAPCELERSSVLRCQGKALKLDPEEAQSKLRRYRALFEGARTYLVLEYAQLDELAKSPRYDVKGRSDPALAGHIGLVAVDTAKGELLWTDRIANGRFDGRWEIAHDADTFFIRVLESASAIAKGSGYYRWLFYEDAHGVSLNERYLLDWRFVGRSILFQVLHRVDYEMYPKPPTTYELDADTGLRVYRVTKMPVVTPRPIYVHHFQPVEYPGDRPAPQTPLQFDGLWMERTVLMWNKQTREGVILNPELAILPQIVEVAQKQTVSGKKVQWKYVLDLEALSASFPRDRMRGQVMHGYKDPVARDDEILHWPLGEFRHSGEKIVADALARRLGAATLPVPTPERTELEAAPLFVFRDMYVHERASIATNDYGNHIKVKWGPYVLYQRTTDWTNGYFKMEPPAK